MPWLPTRSISACSTSTVARASSSARWVGVVAAPNSRASADEPHAGRLVAGEHPAGQLDGAQHRRPRPGDAAAFGGRPQEADVEAGVVGDEHGAAGELEEGRQHRVDARRVAHHRGGDAGQRDDLGRDRAAGVDQGGELTEHHAAAHLDRADLGDRVAVVAGGAAAGGLQVDHDERGLPQRQVSLRIDVGEAELPHGRDGRQSHRQRAVATRGRHARRLVGGRRYRADNTHERRATMAPDRRHPVEPVRTDTRHRGHRLRRLRGARPRLSGLCRECVAGGAGDVADDERRALEVLAEAGLAPRLRLVPIHRHGDSGSCLTTRMTTGREKFP